MKAEPKYNVKSAIAMESGSLDDEQNGVVKKPGVYFFTLDRFPCNALKGNEIIF